MSPPIGRTVAPLLARASAARLMGCGVGAALDAHVAAQHRRRAAHVVGEQRIHFAAQASRILHRHPGRLDVDIAVGDARCRRSTNPPSIVSWPPLAEPLRPRSSIRFAAERDRTRQLGDDDARRGERNLRVGQRRLCPTSPGWTWCRRRRRPRRPCHPRQRCGTKADSTRSTAMPLTVRFSAGIPADKSIEPPNASSLPAASHTTSSMVMRPLSTEMVVGGVCLTSMPAVVEGGRIEDEPAGGAHRVQLGDGGGALSRQTCRRPSRCRACP